MSPHEQLILGVAAGLTVYALLRLAPLLRDLLAAIAAASLIYLLISYMAQHGSGTDSLPATLPSQLLSHPYLALAAAGVVAVVLYVSRLR
jgi:hypothetical protein